MNHNHKLLLEMLAYKRPAGSRTEEKWIKRFIDSVDGIQSDTYGNRFIVIGNQPRVMFTAHTDTVHHAMGKQTVYLDSFTGDAFVDPNKSNCLGADDATGCYIMLRMIEQRIPGIYCFFRDEEIGGLGSQYFIENPPIDVDLYSIDQCISFDRRGTSSVITHQRGEQCCSDQYAQALTDQLGNGYKTDETGIFTDSANFVDIIPECTNLSVGYDSEHTENEIQSLTHLNKLLPALFTTQWANLPIEREPISQTIDSKHHGQGYYYYLDLVENQPDVAADLLTEAIGQNWVM